MPEYLSLQDDLRFQRRFWSKVRKTNSCWLWTASVKPAGYGQIQQGQRGGKLLYAHIAAYYLLVGPVPEGFELDHECRNPRCVRPESGHVRIATRSQNHANCLKRRDSSSPFKGVRLKSDHYREFPWHAFIRIEGVSHPLGSFSTPEEAAHAYDEAAVLIFGEFALTNGEIE